MRGRCSGSSYRLAGCPFRSEPGSQDQGRRLDGAAHRRWSLLHWHSEARPGCGGAAPEALTGSRAAHSDLNLEAKTRDEGWTALRIADGVYYTGTVKRGRDAGALLRKLLQARGLPIPI